MPKTKPKESPPASPPSPEERMLNREVATRLALLFLSREAKRRQRVRLIVLREPVPFAAGGVCVGSTLEALARLYPNCEVIGVGLDRQALKARWPAAPVREAASLPPPSLGDRWVYYDSSALEGQGGWRLARPL
jgi:hypothetical protein